MDEWSKMNVEKKFSVPALHMENGLDIHAHTVGKTRLAHRGYRWENGLRVFCANIWKLLESFYGRPSL